MNVAKIGNKEIGPKKKLFITFECGPTHTGFESANAYNAALYPCGNIS